MIVQLQKLPDYVKHTMQFKLIAKPGFLGFEGGIFNPGAVEKQNEEILILAKGQSRHWRYATGNKSDEYLQGAPVVITLDRNLEVKSSYVIKSLLNFPTDKEIGIEDFRMFHYDKKIWVNHNLISIWKRGPYTGYKESIQVLSHLEPTKKTLVLKGIPNLDMSINKIEKNWIYKEVLGRLYLFYSFQPYRVFKLVDATNLTFTELINRKLNLKLGTILDTERLISFSTNPIDYDDQYLLVLIHQVALPNKMWYRLYYHWGLLIDKKMMHPKKITFDPLFSGKGARGKLGGILYVMSVIRKRDDFVFFNGEGDAYLSKLKVAKSKIEKLWVDLPEL
jgi:hypothetical protein